MLQSGNRTFKQYTLDKMKPRIFQQESVKEFFDWKRKMGGLVMQARKFLSGYCTQVTALQLCVARVNDLHPKLVVARAAMQNSSKRTSVKVLKRRTETVDKLQVVHKTKTRRACSMRNTTYECYITSCSSKCIVGFSRTHIRVHKGGNAICISVDTRNSLGFLRSLFQ